MYSWQRSQQKAEQVEKTSLPKKDLPEGKRGSGESGDNGSNDEFDEQAIFGKKKPVNLIMDGSNQERIFENSYGSNDYEMQQKKRDFDN